LCGSIVGPIDYAHSPILSTFVDGKILKK
jgi:hypothetical protein